MPVSADDFLSAQTKQPQMVNPAPAGVTAEDFLAGGAQVAPARPAARGTFQEAFESGTAPTTDPARTAGVGTLALSSLPRDRVNQVQVIASRLFPDEPPEQAIQRFGFVGDDLVFADDQGKLVKATPQGAGLPQVARGAQSVGPAIPAVAGLAGAAFTRNPAGVGAATAAGEGTRQFLANVLVGEEPSLQKIGVEGVIGGAGQGIGNMLVKTINARRLRDFGEGVNLDSAKELADKALKQFDIRLTPAEATNLASLIRQQKVVAGTLGGDDVLRDFFGLRNERIRGAVLDVLADISPKGSAFVARREGAAGAKEAILKEVATRREQASPLYQQAFEEAPAVDIGPVLADLGERIDVTAGPVKAALVRARDAMVRRNPDAGSAPPEGIAILRETLGAPPVPPVPKTSPKTDLLELHNAKLAIDDMLKTAGRKDSSIGNVAKRELQETKKALVSAMEDASLTYKTARETFEETSPPVTDLTKGIVGDIAKLEGDKVLRASRILFSPQLSDPVTIGRARDAFLAAGQKDQWNGLVRSHLQEIFESIPESAAGGTVNLGGTFMKAAVGSPKKQAMLIEALKHEPEKLRTAQFLFTVLNATGRASRQESATAFLQQGIKELRDQAPGLIPGERLATGAVETLEIWRTPSRIASYISDVRTGKHSEELAKMITSDEGLQLVKRLRQVGPNSRAAVIALSHALTRGVQATTADFLTSERTGPVVPPNRPPQP